MLASNSFENIFMFTNSSDMDSHLTAVAEKFAAKKYGLVFHEAARSLLGEQCLHPFYDLARSRIPKAVGIDNFSPIDVHAELAKSAFDRFGLDVIFFA